MDTLGYQIVYDGSLILLFMGLMLFSKMVNDWVTPFSVDDELTQKDNIAFSVSIGGYFVATTIVYVGALVGPSKGLFQDVVTVGGYSILGILLLNGSRWINDKFILYKFSNVKEIITDRNVGTGAVQFASYIASGLIVAGAISGLGGGLVTALAFFLLGQFALILFTWMYNVITPFDVHTELEKDNVAAGVAFGGALISLGVILMKGASGDFVSWSHNLKTFGLDALLIFILFPIVRLFFDKVIIPKSDLNREITHDQNLGAGILEALVMIGFSVILFFVVS
ncbi:MAG: DUF350 domain-containing protein [Kiritimatiellae bacterium]|nr:DUF350 domain-containing protein [Kiritimatiellia bacterium]